MEKYALLVGGAATHRHDLSQMVMLKGASVHIYVYYVVLDGKLGGGGGGGGGRSACPPPSMSTQPRRRERSYLPTHAPQPTPPHEQTDNHVWSAGSITKAVHTARGVAGFSMKIEVEARTVEEALEAVRCFFFSKGGRLRLSFWRRRPGLDIHHAHTESPALLTDLK